MNADTVRAEDSSKRVVYRKSAKGGQAIATRAHGLMGRPRSLLILVDGRRTGAELQALGAGFGDVPLMLAQLEADGFIDAVAPVAVPGLSTTASAARQSGPPADAPAPANLPAVKSFTTRRLLELLGPTSEPLCLRIEAATDMPAFVEAVKRAFIVVRDIRGAVEAERFGAAVEAQLPGY